MTTLEQVHRLAISQDVGTLAQSLQETLGQRLVAYAVGIRDPKAIGKYARGRAPRAGTEARLRDVFQVTRLLLDRESAATTRAWMIGANPQLDDQAPIELLHQCQLGPVLRAAEAFVQGG